MKYIDFDEIWDTKKQPIFLDEKVAKFLFKQKEDINFFASPLDSLVPIKSKSKLSLFESAPHFLLATV